MVLSLAYQYFDDPFLLLLVVPLFFLLVFLIRKDFVKTVDRERRSGLKFWFFLMRFVIFTLLITALASPFVLEERLVSGEPSVVILVDNSTSFDVFDKTAGERLKEELEKRIKTDIRFIGGGERSNLGERILENMRLGESVLLVSDGYSNEGLALGDVVLYATQLNVSINAISLKPAQEDYRVEIRGPSKVIADVENIFTVNVAGTNAAEHRVTVVVDGVTVVDKRTKEDVKFTQKFSDGYHKITAQIYDDDYFPHNNVFYKTVKVVKKPRVLLVTEKETPLSILIRDLYDLEVRNTIDGNLQEFYATLLNDLPLRNFDAQSVGLSEYVGDGDGLVVFGGQQSYDRGDYKGSAFERMLPVFVAGAGKEESDITIVIVIDISGSVTGSAVDVEKALAISVLRNIRRESNVGIVAFDTQGYIVAPVESLLRANQQELESKIGSLRSRGGTLIGAGISEAVDLLSKTSGSKNIVLISDGNTQGRDAAYAAAQNAAHASIKIFTLGVGESTNERIMETIAEIGSGSYFRVEEARNVKILFGDPDDREERGGFGVVLIDKNHFITQDLEIHDPNVYGYNEVIPKSTAKLLVTTSGGNPLVSVWRFGLGRVASVSTDDGSVSASDLLSRDNGGLLIRTINWAIGDPERKSASYIDIQDTRIHEHAEILYKTSQQPTAKDVTFYKIGEHLYSGSLLVESVGFKSILGADFAVNYDDEYAGIGLSPGLQSVVQGTGGTMFGEGDIEQMVAALREQSKHTSFQKWYYRWHLVLAALLFFLFDIFVRKMVLYRQR